MKDQNSVSNRISGAEIFAMILTLWVYLAILLALLAFCRWALRVIGWLP